MKITKTIIEEVAKLAKLDVPGRSSEIYADQLSGIFNYIEQLNEVDVSLLEPTAQVTGLNNVYRADIIDNCSVETRASALNQVDLEKNNIKVPRILS